MPLPQGRRVPFPPCLPRVYSGIPPWSSPPPGRNSATPWGTGFMVKYSVAPAVSGPTPFLSVPLPGLVHRELSSGNQGGCAINATGFKWRAAGTSLVTLRHADLHVFDRTAPGGILPLIAVTFRWGRHSRLLFHNRRRLAIAPPRRSHAAYYPLVFPGYPGGRRPLPNPHWERQPPPLPASVWTQRAR